MNMMKKKIIHILKQKGKKGIGIHQLEKQLKCTKGGRKSEYYDCIEKLLHNEEILIQKQKLYLSTASKGIRAEIVRLNTNFGFAQSTDGKTEYFIPGKMMMGTLPGDKVLLKLIPGKGDNPQAKVIQILSYGSGEFTGKIISDFGSYAILPDNMIKYPIYVSKHHLNGAKDGDKVLATISSRGTRHSEHEAKVISTYGNAETASSCARAILDLHGITDEFPFEVIDQARFMQKRGIKSKDYNHRADFRSEIVFTIDSADAKDLDDAVSLTKFDDCYQLGVHIADVSHYVPFQSAIDKEAFQRGTSIYYADKVIPMLPKELSNGICSLTPNQDRLTFSALLTIDLNGNLIDFDFQKSVICSCIKGVYSEINSIFDNTASSEILEKYQDISDKLFLMKELAELRIKQKKLRGAPEIITHESKIITNSQGIAIDVIPRVQGISEKIIEEFMLLANEAAAMAGKMKELPFIYRVHESPSEEKMELLNITLKLLGLQNRNLSSNIKPKALAEILDKSKNSNINSIINMQVLRSMAKAKYSELPLGHFGLALENYSHFTSPIRRYPDLQIHRILTAYLNGMSGKEIRKQQEKHTIKSAIQASCTEMAAIKIERECEDCYKAEYMSEFIGEVFTGMICSVSNNGIYVELPNTVDGLIKREDLPKGEYYFDGIMQYKNMTTGQIFKIGDTMTVKCVGCNVNNGNIDFEPILE